LLFSAAVIEKERSSYKFVTLTSSQAAEGACSLAEFAEEIFLISKLGYPVLIALQHPLNFWMPEGYHGVGSSKTLAILSLL
jgi:hypothetical protein